MGGKTLDYYQLRCLYKQWGYPLGEELFKFMGCTSSHTFRRIRERLFSEQEGLCFWCGKVCTLPIPREFSYNHPDAFTVDHIQPRWRGGKDSVDNLVGACTFCNQLRASIESRLLSGGTIEGYACGLQLRDYDVYLPRYTVEEVLVNGVDPIYPHKPGLCRCPSCRDLAPPEPDVVFDFDAAIDQAARLLKGHYRLMARKDFWYDPRLQAASARLCAKASDLRHKARLERATLPDTL